MNKINLYYKWEFILLKRMVTKTPLLRGGGVAFRPGW